MKNKTLLLLATAFVFLTPDAWAQGAAAATLDKVTVSADAAKRTLTKMQLNAETLLVSDHAVCGAKVGFAEIFLMPQPPLLTRECALKPNSGSIQ